MAEERRCIKCDQLVKEQTKPLEREDGTPKQYGRGEVEEGYVHTTSSEDGVPNCGRRVLPEHMTYTTNVVSATEVNDRP